MLRVKSPVIIHLVAWLIFMMLPFITMPGPESSKNILPVIQSLTYWSSIALYLFVFYFNGYFLIPRLYLQKKYFIYTVSVLGVLVAAYFLKHYIDSFRTLTAGIEGGRFYMRGTGQGMYGDSLRRFADSFRNFGDSPRPFPNDMPGGPLPPANGRPFSDSLWHAGDSLRHFPGGLPPIDGGFGPGRQPQRRHIVDLFSIFLLSTIWALSTALRITQQWSETEQRAVKAEADKANAELSFLKAQINPHFLFNTLNNIYSLAVRQHENTADSIMKLSNIMRYVTDDVNRDFVSLESEVACITDYIDLQRLRLSKKVHIDFAVSGNPDGKRIPPLVLMTFIENVFKYGISSHEPSTITIKLFAEEKNITFFCQNKLFSTERRVERTGIGIINTKQRLEHVYPNRHLLNISTDDGLYTVQLTLMV